jgi:hypothetical protein
MSRSEVNQPVRAVRYEGPATGGSSLPQRFMLEGSERTVTDAVNAYRSVVRDAEKAIRGSLFTALTQVPESPTGRVQDLVAMLEEDGVRLADYREALAIAQDIALDLRAPTLVAPA